MHAQKAVDGCIQVTQQDEFGDEVVGVCKNDPSNGLGATTMESGELRHEHPQRWEDTAIGRRAE